MNDIERVREKMIDFYSGDAKRIFHFLKVHDLAEMICQSEKIDERTQYVRDVALVSQANNLTGESVSFF